MPCSKIDRFLDRNDLVFMTSLLLAMRCCQELRLRESTAEEVGSSFLFLPYLMDVLSAFRGKKIFFPIRHSPFRTSSSRMS